MSEPSNVIARLEKGYAGAVFDVLRAMGHRNCALPSTIRPLDPTKKLVGRVFTVNGHAAPASGPAPGMDAHETLIAWTGLLAKAPRDHVLVCQPNDLTMSHMGELSSETLQFRGVRGYVVDGGCRDTDFILRLGFPVFCRYFTPVDIVSHWIPDAFGQPITIGSVTIRTGDVIFADRDGVVVIPGELAEEVATRVEEVMRTENLVRKAILQGVDPQEAYLKYGKF